jgi:hypothetical protein
MNDLEYTTSIYRKLMTNLEQYMEKNPDFNSNFGLYISTTNYKDLKNIKEIEDFKKQLGL